jgi:hypothetical protein
VGARLPHAAARNAAFAGAAFLDWIDRLSHDPSLDLGGDRAASGAAWERARAVFSDRLRATGETARPD